MEKGSRTQQQYGTAMLGVLFLFSLSATVLLTVRSNQIEHERDVTAVNQVATRFAASLESTIASLGGANVLALDGAVEEAEFAAFASEIVVNNDFSAVAFSDIVPGPERERWESRAGVTIVDTDGEGGLQPAEPRPEHLPVRFVWPDTEVARAVRGFDLNSDPVRRGGAGEARSARSPVLVGPIRLASSGEPGVFVIQDVTDPAGETIGFLASGISVEPILEQVLAQSALTDPEVGVWIDGSPLTGADSSGPRVDVSVGQRVFTLQTHDTRDAGWTFAAIGIVFAGLLLVATISSWRRDIAERRRRARSALRSAALSELAEALAGANSVETTMTVGLDRARSALGSAFATVGRKDPSDPSKLVMAHDSNMDDRLHGTDRLQRLDAQLPLTHCVNTGEVLVVANRVDYEQRYPHLIASVDAAGIRAVVCSPIRLRHDDHDDVVGALGFGYTDDLHEDEVLELQQTGEAAAMIYGRALERSLARDAARDHAERLSVFAAALATAHTPTDVLVALEMQLPSLLGVRAATLTSESLADAGPGRRFQLPSASDTTSLRLADHPGRTWDATDEALARTVLQLVDAAWARARQHDQEHGVLDRLQTTLLSGAPIIDGLDVAVAYRSALDTVGIGGDWYSVVERPDVTYLVVGDVTGHGAEAIAVMAEAKTVIRHLLSSGAPMDEVVRHADNAVARRGSFASLIIVCIEHAHPRFTYVNAGHPYPIVKRAGEQATAITKTHRPLIGIHGSSPSPTVHDFAVGDTLLLYTDGLIERRGRTITHSIDELSRRLGDADELTCAQLVERLLDFRHDQVGHAGVDDDIAIVAVRRTAQI